jgi:hypothetical protein
MAVLESTQGVDQQVGALPRQTVQQFATGVLGSDGHRALGQDGPRIHAGVHLHDGHPRPRVAVQDGILDRGNSAPARQQAGVDVDATEGRRRQKRFAQYVPKGRDDHRIGFEGQHLLADGLALPLAEIDDRQTVLSSCGLHGRRQHFAAASGPAVGLRDHELHVEARFDQGLEARHREIR